MLCTYSIFHMHLKGIDPIVVIPARLRQLQPIPDRLQSALHISEWREYQMTSNKCAMGFYRYCAHSLLEIGMIHWWCGGFRILWLVKNSKNVRHQSTKLTLNGILGGGGGSDCCGLPLRLFLHFHFWPSHDVRVHTRIRISKWFFDLIIRLCIEFDSICYANAIPSEFRNNTYPVWPLPQCHMQSATSNFIIIIFGSKTFGRPAGDMMHVRTFIAISKFYDTETIFMCLS